jgi:hypothetical protein
MGWSTLYHWQSKMGAPNVWNGSNRVPCNGKISIVLLCHNPNIRFRIKARAYKGAGQELAQKSYFMLPRSVRECEGMNPHTPKWTPTLGVPLWELESQWILESLKGDCKGQNSLDWKVICIIENILERKCLKWARMTHLGI